MRRLLRCLVSLALVFCSCSVSLTAFAVDPVEEEDSGTYSIVAKEGAVLSWNDFDIGSSRVGSTYTIPAGNYTFKGVPSGTSQNVQLGGGRLSDWGEGLSEPTGWSVSSNTMQLSMGPWEYHTSMKGTFRFVLYENVTPDTKGSPFYHLPTSVHIKVLALDGSILAEDNLRQSNGDWAVDLSWPEHKVQRVVLSITFPNTSKTNNIASWYRYCGVTCSTTIRWDGSTSSSETSEGILEGVNQGNDLQAESNGLLSGIIELITSLPDAIGEAIQGLFIPNEQNINIIRGKWQEFLVNKMGFIYQCFEWVDTFFEGIIDGLSGEDDGAFTIPAFPAFEAGGETVQLWSEPLTVDFSDNAFVQTLQPIACPFILGVTAYHLWFSMSDLMECFFAGKSYRDFSHRRDGE